MRRTEARSPRPPAVAPSWPPAHDLLRAACVHAFLVALFLWPVFTGRLLSQTGALREMPPWRGAVPAVASPLPGTVSMNRMLDDQTREFLPFFLVARESLRRGELPLWNPTIFAGTPLLGDAQSAVLFPLNFGHYLLPTGWGFTASAAAKLLFSALAAYVLGRRLGQSHAGALVAGAAWAFCSFTVFWLSHPHTNATLLFPLLLSAAEETVDFPGRRVRIALAALVALQLLGGHVEIAFLEAVAGAAWLALRCLQAGRTPWRPFSSWIAGHLLGAAAGGIVLLPFAEFLLHSATWSIRSAENPFFLPQVAWTALLLPGLFALPGWGEGPHLLHALAPHVGMLTLVLAGTALFAARSGPPFALAALGVLGWAIATGPGAVGRLLVHLPLFRQNPNYYALLLPLLAIALLAGFGVDVARSYARRPEERPRVRRAFLLAAALPAAVLAAVLVDGGSLLGPVVAALGARDPDLVVRGASAAARIAFANLALAAAASAALARSAAPGSGRLLLLLLFAQLWCDGSRWNPWLRADEVMPPPPAVVAAIERGDTPPRIAALGGILPPDTGVFADLHDIRGYDVPVQSSFHEWFERALGGRDSFWIYELPAVRAESQPFLDAASVEWLLSPSSAKPGTPPDAGATVEVRRNDGAFPRAYFLASAEAAADRTAALDRVVALGSALRDTVVLEGDPQVPVAELRPPTPDDERGPRPARIVRHLARRVEIDVDAPCAGWLVLTDADYPGWRARVDGVATPIRRANALFRAVHVGPGEHRVEFDYDPVSARFGLFTGLAFLGYCLVPWLTRR
ncbi:MAG: hypothetical protein RL698_2398 [Pseudomonadota bacterium]